MANKFDELLNKSKRTELMGISKDTDRVHLLPVDKLHEFKDHKFKVIDNEEMKNLRESIEANGILQAIDVRPDESEPGTYEVLSGHRRLFAAKQLGLTEVRCIPHYGMDDDAAIIFVCEANAYREGLLPSEKGWYYRLKKEAMDRQMAKGILTAIAEEEADSRPQIARFIRLTYLDQPLLDAVDEGKMSMGAGVAMSYLTQKEQRWIIEYVELNEAPFPTEKQAIILKEMSEKKKLTAAKLQDVLDDAEKKPHTKSLTLKQKYLKKYFPPTFTKQDRESIIYQLLEEWAKKEGYLIDSKAK